MSSLEVIDACHRMAAQKALAEGPPRGEVQRKSHDFEMHEDCEKSDVRVVGMLRL